MVDAQAGVAAVGISEIIPEGVYPLVGMKLSEGIRPTLRKKVAIGARTSGRKSASSNQRSGL
jgi:hypothetical protein